MSFLIVMIVIFCLVSIFDTGKRIESTNEHRKRTITNVKLQDELWCKNFKMVMEDLEAINKKTPLNENTLMTTIEQLFNRYDIPNTRTKGEEAKARAAYLAKYKRFDFDLRTHYARQCLFAESLNEPPPKEPIVTLQSLIWHYPFDAPRFDKLELLFGTPYDSIEVDGITYEYNAYGRAYNLFVTEPSKLIFEICNLLTVRSVHDLGYNYSWDRQESLWQQSEQSSKDYEENKKKYPWL